MNLHGESPLSLPSFRSLTPKHRAYSIHYRIRIQRACDARKRIRIHRRRIKIESPRERRRVARILLVVLVGIPQLARSVDHRRRRRARAWTRR